MSFDPESTLPLIVCPQSHAPLVYESGALVSADPNTRLKYEIRDGIPVLLIDESEELAMEEWSAIMEKHGRDPVTGQSIEPTIGQME